MKPGRGFSLLELLIVMAIVAILIIIAYPLYTDYLTQARRNQAEVGLLHLASQMESFYSRNDTYQGATLDSLGVNAYTDDHTYAFSIPSATDAGYRVAATPLAQQARQDSGCGVLSLNEIGERQVSGNTPVDQCW